MVRAALLSTKQVSVMLGVSEGTLRWWRTTGIGPHWIRVGPRLVRYDPEELELFLRGRVDAGFAD